MSWVHILSTKSNYLPDEHTHTRVLNQRTNVRSTSRKYFARFPHSRLRFFSPTLPSLYTIFSSARHLCNLSSQRRYDTPAGSILRYTASSPFFYESRKALLLFAKVIHTRHRSASTCLTRRGGSFYCAKPPSEPIRCNGLPAAGDFLLRRVFLP